AVRAPRARVGGRERAGLAGAGQDPAHEPLLAADRLLRERRAVREQLRPFLDLPARDPLRVPDPRHDAGAAEVVGPEAVAGLERLTLQPGAAHPVEPEGTLRVACAIPRVDVPVGQLPLDHVGLDESRRERVLALLLVLDLDHAVLADALAQRRHELLLGPGRLGLRRLAKVELAERLLELLP